MEMEVFEFKKSLLVRHQEATHVLNVRGVPIPASAVKKEWSLFLEVAMESNGWQALWRIPRAVCQELSKKFPTVVAGTVEKVLFDELKAIIYVEAVEDDDLHLPERQLVSLSELWPLRHQKNTLLNVERTADCLDQLRFFYQHVWMPWDYDNDDDDRDWGVKHLDSRMKFYCDLKNRTMPKRLTSHVLTLLDEANQLQKKRELLTLHMDDEDEVALMDGCPASELLRIRLRIQDIKNEIETLEFFAPKMRKIYEQVRFPKETYYSKDQPSGDYNPDSDSSAYVVTHIGSLAQQIDYLETAKRLVGTLTPVRICYSLQDALDRSESSAQMLVSPGRHDIKLRGDLSSKGSIQAVVGDRSKTVICSRQDDNALLTITGDYRLENVTLDCTNVQTGILIKRGTIMLKNCCLKGDPRDVSSSGILICGNATLLLENCQVQNFSTGISANASDCDIRLLNETTVQDCIEGIKLVEGCRFGVSSSKIINCRNYGVVLEVEEEYDGQQRDEAITCYHDHWRLSDREEFNIGKACQFESNGRGNFAIVNTNY
ncbi:protein nessun dorma [Aedes albopictus]|uniref:SHC SH2 domain-containing protein n=1 Tax=Aedes albopictus TaxID=7160 RepID=A0ABM1YF61_AEDAL